MSNAEPKTPANNAFLWELGTLLKLNIHPMNLVKTPLMDFLKGTPSFFYE